MSIRVLLAEDHLMLREGLKALLEQSRDVQVVADVEDGQRAVTVARQLLPHVVVMDISMPILNGVEATRQISSELPNTRVICLSMHADRHTLAAALSAGASGYVLKECAGEELLTAVRVVAQKRSYLSPAVTDEVVRGYVRLHAIDGAGAAHEQLSGREREVLQLIAEGYRSKEIAQRLYLSVKTVCSHRSHIMEKLNLKGAADIAKYALREGLTSV